MIQTATNIVQRLRNAGHNALFAGGGWGAPAAFGRLEWIGFTLTPAYVDRLSIAFLHVFTLMAFIDAVYGLHVDDRWQHVAAALYVAGSLGVTLAGDYLTLFVFWELMAFASTFLVWLRRTPESTRAGYRYLLVHVAGGLVLMAASSCATRPRATWP